MAGGLAAITVGVVAVVIALSQSGGGSPDPGTGTPFARPATSSPNAAVPSGTTVSASPSPGVSPSPSRSPSRTSSPTPKAAVVLAGWPTPKGQEAVTATKPISGDFNGGMKRFYGSGDLGTGDQSEGQDPLFTLSNGATLRNVIIDAPPRTVCTASARAP
jgi:pectate lyase